MKSFKKFFLWILSAILTGAICGLCGTVFSKSVAFVTDIRIQNNWILYLLPIGGLISIYTYKLLRVTNAGTTTVFSSSRSEQALPNGLPLAVFLGTCVSHLFGASAGREGAALQIGGGVANILSKAFKFDEDSRRVTVMCGMAALFSAVFGTPLAAFVFIIEVILTKLCIKAAIPILISSFTAFIVSQLLHVHPERFNIGDLPALSWPLVLKVSIITIACILVSFVFCKGLSLGKTFAKHFLKNEILRIAMGGIVIIGLTLLVGNRDYNGGGIDVIERIFNENYVRYEAFAIKLLFTIICVSCGFKGGEIIPTLFIGATLGGVLALILSLPLGIGAAVGMAVLFATATKCPISTILLCGEMFGFYCLPLVAPIVILSFIAARYKGLYGDNKDYITLIKAYKKA